MLWGSIRILMVCLLVVSTVASSSGVEATPAVAEQQQPKITQTMTFHLTPEQPGSVIVDVSYDVSQDVDSFSANIGLFSRHAESIEAAGFDPSDNGFFYSWDRQSENPRFRFVIGNVTDSLVGGYNGVDVGSWAALPVGRQTISIGFEDSTGVHNSIQDPESVRQVYDVDSNEGVVFTQFTYIGSFDTWAFETQNHRFTVIVPEKVTSANKTAIISSLTQADSILQSTSRRDINVFIGPSPLRRGGSATSLIGSEATFVVHESAPPHGTWLHEYAHTQQNVTVGSEMSWYIEGSATYLQQALALETGQITYRGYVRQARSVPEAHRGVALSSIRGWAQPSYQKGARVLAALDAKIRLETDGNATFRDVFHQINEHDGVLEYEDFVDISSDVAGTPMQDWLDRYVRTTALPDVPSDPTLFFDSESDPDGDGLTIVQERDAHTDAFRSDTDRDGVTDGEELELALNATARDTDTDGLIDGQELAVGSDPLNPDTDGDGLSDGEENNGDSDPTSADTDGDGLDDGYEKSNDMNVVNPDIDADGLTDGKELELDTDPYSRDTDGDGLTDGDEVNKGTDPLDQQFTWRSVSRKVLVITGLSALLVGMVVVNLIRGFRGT